MNYRSTGCWFRRCWFRRCFVFRHWYRGCNVNRIGIAISWIGLGSFVFARCSGYEKLLILVVPATALSSRRFFSHFFWQHRRQQPTDGVVMCILHRPFQSPELGQSQHTREWISRSCSSWLNHVASWVRDIEEGSSAARGAIISVMFRHCESSRSFVWLFAYADKLVAQLNCCASSTSHVFARLRTSSHVCADDCPYFSL